MTRSLLDNQWCSRVAYVTEEEELLHWLQTNQFRRNLNFKVTPRSQYMCYGNAKCLLCRIQKGSGVWETAKHVKSKESEQICLKLNVVPKGKRPNMKNSNMKNWRRKSTE